MEEFWFVLKSLGITVFILFMMQIKVSGTSLESRTESLLRTSKMTSYLQDSAHGAVKLFERNVPANIRGYLGMQQESLSSKIGVAIENHQRESESTDQGLKNLQHKYPDKYRKADITEEDFAKKQKDIDEM